MKTKRKQVRPRAASAVARLPPQTQASLVACNHFGCNAQPNESCSDTNFDGGTVNTTPFTIDGKPAFHAERISTAAFLQNISSPVDPPTPADLDKAVDSSGLV